MFCVASIGDHRYFPHKRHPLIIIAQFLGLNHKNSTIIITVQARGIPWLQQHNESIGSNLNIM